MPVEGPVLYGLSGVVVHVGRSANRGHFYSLIARRPDPANGEENGDGSGYEWVQFDDANVTAFDKQGWEQDTFGGSHDPHNELDEDEDDDDDYGVKEEGRDDLVSEIQCGIEEGDCDTCPAALVNGWCNNYSDGRVGTREVQQSVGYDNDNNDGGGGGGSSNEVDEDLYHCDNVELDYSDDDDDSDVDDDDSDSDSDSDSDTSDDDQSYRFRSAVLLFYTIIDE